MVNAPERYVSTGRGGAANFKKANKLAKANAEAQASRTTNNNNTQEDEECVLTRVVTQASLGARFATGRGGAGNILPIGTVPLPQTAPSQSLERPIVRVGRGGAGNFKDSKTGRSVSSSQVPQDLLEARKGWASRVPKIDAELLSSDSAIDSAIESRRNSISSCKSAPAQGSLFGKLRRRFSSFGTALE